MKPPASNRTTSAAAAHRIAPHQERLQKNVLRLLAGRGRRGATDEEMAATLQLKMQTLVPRRWELVRAGRVADSGATRPTASGAQAIVWILVPEDRGSRTGAARWGAGAFPGAALCFFCRTYYEPAPRRPGDATPENCCRRAECRERLETYTRKLKERGPWPWSDRPQPNESA